MHSGLNGLLKLEWWPLATDENGVRSVRIPHEGGLHGRCAIRVQPHIVVVIGRALVERSQTVLHFIKVGGG